jgi:hypothetical protein
VADGALKCFASLADRFIRKNVDPMPLAAHGLTKELLNRLSSAGNRQGGITNAVTGTPGTGATSTPGESFPVLKTFKLLTTLHFLLFFCLPSTVIQIFSWEKSRNFHPGLLGLFRKLFS